VSTPTVLVWDRAVRVLHWALVGAVALAALGTVVLVRAHQGAGYAALAIVALRLLWGGVGGRYARWRQFVRAPRVTLRYALAVANGHEPRYLGHNPLGGWMMVALMACIIGLALTGWLYTTDAFWGDEIVERVHRALAWTLLGLVVLHVGGVLFTSLRQRENLVRSMLDGRKRAPSRDDIA
jgi:cytochrome b